MLGPALESDAVPSVNVSTWVWVIQSSLSITLYRDLACLSEPIKINKKTIKKYLLPIWLLLLLILRFFIWQICDVKILFRQSIQLSIIYTTDIKGHREAGGNLEPIPVDFGQRAEVHPVQVTSL